MGCGEESLDIEMGGKVGRTIKNVKQMHTQIWTQQSWKIELRISLLIVLIVMDDCGSVSGKMGN
jgi:hypothetical protein